MNEQAHDNHIERHEDEPAFTVGDKVRVTEYSYIADEYDTIGAINRKSSEALVDSYDGNGSDWFEFSELAHYAEDLSQIQAPIQPLAELHAEIERLQAENESLKGDLLGERTLSSLRYKSLTALQLSDAKHAAIALKFADENAALRKAVDSALSLIESHVGIHYNFPKIHEAKTILRLALSKRDGNHADASNLPNALTVIVTNAPAEEAKPTREYGFVYVNGFPVEMDIPADLATPKYGIGQFVKLLEEYEGEWIGKIVSIRRIEEDSVTYGIEIAGWDEQPFGEDEIEFAADEAAQ